MEIIILLSIGTIYFTGKGTYIRKVITKSRLGELIWEGEFIQCEAGFQLKGPSAVSIASVTTGFGTLLGVVAFSLHHDLVQEGQKI